MYYACSFQKALTYASRKMKKNTKVTQTVNSRPIPIFVVPGNLTYPLGRDSRETTFNYSSGIQAKIFAR